MMQIGNICTSFTPTLPGQRDGPDPGPVLWPAGLLNPCCAIQPSLCCSGQQSESVQSL